MYSHDTWWGASMVKWTKEVLWYLTSKSRSKMLFTMNKFSCWPMLLCQALKCKIPRWDLQDLSLKIMLRSKWLDLVSNINFITLSTLNLIFYLIFLDVFIMYLYHVLDKNLTITCSISSLALISKMCIIFLESVFVNINYLAL